MATTDPIKIPGEVEDDSLNTLRADVTKALTAVALIVGTAVAAFETLQFAIEGSKAAQEDLNRATAVLDGNIAQLQGSLGRLLESTDDSVGFFEKAANAVTLYAAALFGASNDMNINIANQAALNVLYAEAADILRINIETVGDYQEALSENNLEIIRQRNQVRLFSDELEENVKRATRARDLQLENIEIVKERNTEDLRAAEAQLQVAVATQNTSLIFIREQELQQVRIDTNRRLAAQETALIERQLFINEQQRLFIADLEKRNALVNVQVDQVEVTNRGLERELTLRNDLEKATLRQIIAEEERGNATQDVLAITQQGLNSLFEQGKAVQIANAVLNTAQAILATYSRFGLPAGTPFAIAMAALGAAQIAKIAATNPGSSAAPTAISGRGTPNTGGRVVSDATRAAQGVNISGEVAPGTATSRNIPRTVLVLEDFETVQNRVQVVEDASTF